MSTSAQNEIERDVEVLSRVDAVVAQLFAFDRRIDEQASKRLDSIREDVATERIELAVEEDKLTELRKQSGHLGGDMARAMFTPVADRLYDLAVRADVGLLDVVWGLKVRQSEALSRLLRSRGRELQEIENGPPLRPEAGATVGALGR